MRVLLAILLLTAALAGCGGSDKDSDGDGLYNSLESKGWTVVVDLVGRRVEYHVQSDTGDVDTDGDGLTDAEEFTNLPALDPTKVDTDEDGLSDCQEALHSVRSQCDDPAFIGPYDGGTSTDAANADSDAGFSRYVNQVLGFDDETGSVTLPVSWGDGLSDGDEVQGYDVFLASGETRHVRTNPRSGDTDRDGLEDGEEALQFRTDPLVEDTDGDGCRDGLDAIPERNEQYSLGLRSFRLLRDQDLQGGADLHLEVQFLDRSLQIPSQGSKRVETGDEASLASLSPAAARPAGCDFTPSHPWFLVQVTATDLDIGMAPTVLDIHSATRPPGADARLSPAVWWNVRTGELSFQGPGIEAFTGPVRFQGLDGEIEIAPQVV